MTNMLLGILLALIGFVLLFFNRYLQTGPLPKWVIPIGIILIGVGLYLGVFG
jgi:hypothetical protein